jgi:protease-4
MIKAIGNFISDIFKKLFGLIRTILVYLSVAFIIIMIFSFIGRAVTDGENNQAVPIRETVIQNNGGEDKIVLAKLGGLILSEGTTGVLTASEETITPSRVRAILNQAKSDPLVKAVIFDLNSPGGSPVASDRIYEEINNFKRDTGIPVIFLMSEIAASGGYYIASAADYIVANPATITGSIGVIMETYNLEGLYEKLGVRKEIFKQGEYKDILDESRDITDKEREMINLLNKDSYDLFIQRVAAGRKLTEEQVRNLAEGKIYSGKQAKEVQLVDSLGNIDEAVYQTKLLAKIDRFNVVEYDFSSFFQDLFGQVRSQINQYMLLGNMLGLAGKNYQLK